ncbi:MAG: ABC transporter substrate-binding protein, partial [Chloroflexota bacterium]
ALVAGDLQMVEVAGSAVVAAQSSKTNLVMAAGFLNQAVWRIMTPPSITSVDQLKGKAVAVSKIGNADYFAWPILAQHQGWPVDSFKYVAANNPPGQVALLKQGDAFGTAVSPPNDVLAEEKGGAHLLIDETTFDIPEQQVGMALLASYVAQNRTTALNVLKATIEAIHRWKTDPAFAKKIIAKYLKESDQRYVDSGYSAYASLFPETPYPTKNGFASVIKEVATQRPDASSVTPDQCMDNSLVKELSDSGFIKQIYGH